jgi:diadenosine tetraphosphate (Ap4A) HIT family hydrolase
MSKKQNCFFCNPNKNREIFLYQGKYLDSFLEDCPVSPGHFLIFPKRHIALFSEMNEIEWHELYIAINNSLKSLKALDLEKSYKHILENTDYDTSSWYINNILKSPFLKNPIEAYNIGLNDGYTAGKTVEHLHWHVIPRFPMDVPSPEGGVRNVIPSLGNYKLKRS